jgi:hypothetical protein
MNRELLQQALNALRISAPLGHAMEDYEYRHKVIKDIEAELAKPDLSIEANRVAYDVAMYYANKTKANLAAPEPQVCCGDYEKCWKACTPRGRWLAEKELAKPEREHRFDTPDSHIVKWSMRVDPNNFGEPIAQPEQEPLKCTCGYSIGHPLITSCSCKSRKPWVGLTEDEIFSCFAMPDMFALAHAVETKLKEKNT